MEELVTAPEPLITERRGIAGWLIFNRPAAGNAMDAAMMAALPGAWQSFEDDPAVHVIIVSGIGRTFQTGLDMVQLSRDPDALREASRRTKRGNPQLTGLHLGVTKPVITAVNGVCAGGGLHFVTDADIVIAATNATFVDPHVSVGQVSAFESVGLVSRAAFGPVARMVLAGAHERVTAQRAYDLGWISAVVDSEELWPAAQQLAEQIGENPPEALAQSKAALWSALEVGRSAAMGRGRQTESEQLT
jgi:enoyl-CoA hydratase/carnithine racemase